MAKFACMHHHLHHSGFRIQWQRGVGTTEMRVKILDSNVRLKKVNHNHWFGISYLYRDRVEECYLTTGILLWSMQLNFKSSSASIVASQWMLHFLCDPLFNCSLLSFLTYTKLNIQYRYLDPLLYMLIFGQLKDKLVPHWDACWVDIWLIVVWYLGAT